MTLMGDGIALRDSKEMTLERAISNHTTDGQQVILGGVGHYNRPAAAVRELLRQGRRDLEIFSSPISGYDVDLLIGAGAVRRIWTNMNFDYLGMAPNFRHRVLRGEFEAVVCDEATLFGGLRATIEGLPYHPVRSILGSDVVKASPIAEEYVGPTGDRLVAIKALQPQVAILHAQEGDRYGNLRYAGSAFLDLTMAKASDVVIATVDRLVPHASFIADPKRTDVPGFLVTAVVEVPFGAHPCASQGRYLIDERHLDQYMTAAHASAVEGSDDPAFDHYLKTFVHEPVDHFTYLERAAGIAHLHALSRAATPEVDL